MTDRVYAPEIQGKIDEIRNLLLYMKKNIDASFWFEKELRLQLQRFYDQDMALHEMRARQSRCKIEDIMHPDKKEELDLWRKMLKGDLLKDFKDEIQYCLDRISQKRISEFQVETLYKAWFAPDGGTGLSKQFGRILQPSPTGSLDTGAVVVVWTAVHTLKRTPLEAPAVIPKTFYFDVSHVDKTDKEGLPYYFKNDSDGMPIVDQSTVSQTSEAQGARVRKYKGTRFSAEEYAKDEIRQEKLKIKLGEDYRKKKEASRLKRRKERGEAEDRTIDQYEADRKKDIKAQDERREKLEKETGGIQRE